MEMTENDYIAEYVKENYPNILGVNFAFWKMGRIMNKVAKEIVEVFKNIDTKDLEKLKKKMDEEKLKDLQGYQE